ncbi:hypothetical protein niasHT_016866 [Heterodera trifolii]|uniref:Calpain-D n=1 Tax=Heterodera trifolii TaxID=157864 RepID=A0ABD2KV44_9BILA
MDGVRNWSCQRCTLINRINDLKCRACQFECPSVNGRSKFLHKIKLPRISLNSALEKIDNAIDFVANSIVPKSEQNVHFYHAPVVLCEHPQPKSVNWTCPSCAQTNSSTLKKCSWCDTDRVTDATTWYWCCQNSNCALRQPFPPFDLKCPLCRTKTSVMKPGHSKSMPQLSPSSRTTANLSNYAPIDEHQTIMHSQNYHEIMSFCEKNGQFFVDDSFSHSNRSVGSLAQLERRDLTIVWLRPDQIVTRDGRLSRWSVFNDPQPADIEQGLLGNCWLLSALAVISERPDILEKLFITKEYNHRGVYEISLCIDGIWQRIIVDDFFPCHRSNRRLIFAVGRKNQLWVSLVEKALAKAYGNYAILRAGRTVEGLSTLTGQPTLSIDLEYLDMDQHSRTADLDIAWAKLISAREARFLMGCSCGAGKRTMDEAEFQRVGLSPQHAYSLLDVRQTNDGHRVVLLRNPWGENFVWRGEFGSEWPGWTHQLRRELAADAVFGPGTFWMPFEQFVFYFDAVDISQLREHHGWTATRYSVDIGWDEQNSCMIRLIIDEPTELCATLFQQNARTMLDQVDIMLLLHRQEGEATPGELICRSSRRVLPSVRIDDTFLPRGEYLLCAHSFSKFGEQMVSGTIVIHSSREIQTMKLRTTTLDDLRQSMCSLLLEEGVLQNSSSGIVTRYLTNGFAGLALMVDNYNSDNCLKVHSDCQNSTNVLSTRSSLLAFDSIPPLHRQIVTLLTHFEPSQSFMVTHRWVYHHTKFPQLRDFVPCTEFASAQNFPPLQTETIGYLHGPFPVYK